MADTRSYNPLSVEELGRNAARALMAYPPSPLPPAESFDGAGVYTIHYRGRFPLYVGMTDEEPIYVGKADVPGRRRGEHRALPGSPVLYRRLSEHAQSIGSAENLDLTDFGCRWLVLDPVWIGLTEQILISEYRPIWNAVVDGFGIHDPGGGRHNQQRSRWDTLHPGRPWAAALRDRGESQDEIRSAVAVHRNTDSGGSSP